MQMDLFGQEPLEHKIRRLFLQGQQPAEIAQSLAVAKPKVYAALKFGDRDLIAEARFKRDAQIRTLALEGWKAKDIAERLRVSINTVYAAIRDPENNVKATIKEQRIEHIIDLYNEGYRAGEIGNKLDISEPTVRKIINSNPEADKKRHKTAREVNPELRQHKKNYERDQKIIALFNSGATIASLAETYGISRQRVDIIVKEGGGITTQEARALRQQQRKSQEDEIIAEFDGMYLSTLESMAESELTIDETIQRFGILLPGIEEDTIRKSIKKNRLIFNKSNDATFFSDAVLNISFWYVLGLEHAIQSDETSALLVFTAKDLEEFTALLIETGVDRQQIRNILMIAGSAKAAVSNSTAMTIAKYKYDEIRDRCVSDINAIVVGNIAWPPTSQTLMKRLGNGYWTDTLHHFGLEIKKNGRERGFLNFTQDDYHQAIIEFHLHCEETRQSPSAHYYDEWVKEQEMEGYDKPCAASIRNIFKSWSNAQRIVLGRAIDV